ncbi:MAG: DeoR/GlpR family DNA-binding transcription regulator [Streptococcaceae bacterium]|jgi:DeoR/GlpR family transcriptional regulator of sugar metabolism|nr:DeoR/GlpR family DNA-binding transcription regulator [Streptococcaceae bacterium]
MKRQEKIISLVSQETKIEVTRLAELLDVSNVTIRKDLDKLEEKGIIRRQHGFALLNNTDNLNFRLAINHDLKKRIARRAAACINDGDTVMIESGSTCALLAEELAFNRKDITIITNSVFIATYIRKSATCKIILLGGEYQPDSQCNIGPLVKKVVDEFYVDKLFIGVDGVDSARGFRCSDINRSDTTRTMASAAKKVIVLTDSSKFEKNSIITEFQFSEVYQVFTDTDLPDETFKQLQAHHITVERV